MFKQDKPTISIIVPVYNTSIYLEQCLNSIHNQSFKDYEVICVDDGSSDNYIHILKKYEKIIKNFKSAVQNNLLHSFTGYKQMKEVRIRQLYLCSQHLSRISDQLTG